jgi:hypothetical protein
MPDYTYAPAPVLIEVTGEFAIGVSGVLRNAATNAVSPVYDLNGSLLPGVTVGPKGAHQAFKADIPNGILDFGSVLLPSSSLEQQAAGLTALQAATDASAAAASAVSTANAAAATATAVLSQLDGLVSTGDVNTLISVALQAALETAQTPEILRYNFASNTWGGQVRPATVRPVFFLHPFAARPALNGTTAGGTLAGVPGKDWFFEVGVA